MKKVSIIVPAYNVEKYIFDTIKTIEVQTYKNIEIIIVNDGSTDNTLKICQELAKENKNIKLINQSNKGVSEARNKGIEMATGEYIAFIDSDDLLEKDMIELLVKGLEEFNADISICGYKINYNNEYYCYYGTKKIFEYNQKKLIEEFLNEENISVSLWNKLFRKDCIRNIQFAKGIRINEDKLFLLKAILNSQKAVYHDICKYIYIKRENSATTSKFSEKLFDVIKVNKMIKDTLAETKYSDLKLIEINEIINLAVIYRMMLLSKSEKEYAKEYNYIKKTIKESKVKIKEIYIINKTKAIEIAIIKYFNHIYKFSIIVGKKIKFIKKLKNWRKKNEIRNSNIS